jgi:2Fe-2S ferredoxin
MPRIIFQPLGKTVKARLGQTIIQLARSARLIIPQRCGGHASCLMCKIVVEQGLVQKPTALEQRKLSEADLAAGIRLACQARVDRFDCTIRIPENKLKSVVAQALQQLKQKQQDE